MMESNAQGHGAIKKAVISTLAISALGVTTGVSANETEVAVNEPATKVVANNEVVAKVPTQADVDKAKAESDKANQDVAKQKEVVASAEANIATAKKELARLEGIAEVKARGYENFKQLKAEHDAYLAEQQRLQALKEKEEEIRKAGEASGRAGNGAVVAKDEVVPKVPTQADVDKAKAESDKANQDVAKQKEVVASAEANIATAKKELARLEGIAEVKARRYENFKQLKADHDAYLAEQQRLQALKDKEDAIRKAGGEVKPVLDADGKVIDVVDAKAQNKVVVATVGTKDDKTYQAPAQATNAKAEPKKQLPNTGTKDSGLLALLGASLGLLALAGKRKYNR